MFSLKPFAVLVMMVWLSRRAWFVGGRAYGVSARWQCGEVGCCKVKAQSGCYCYSASWFGGSSFASCKRCKFLVVFSSELVVFVLLRFWTNQVIIWLKWWYLVQIAAVIRVCSDDVGVSYRCDATNDFYRYFTISGLMPGS